MWAALLIVSLGAASALAEDPSPGQALEQLQGWLDGTRDLAGPFRQRLVSGALGVGQEESGRLWVQRPGRLRWDYLEPERKVALIENGRTSLYLEEDRQFFRGRLDEQGEILPLLLAGDRPLAELFEPQAADVGQAEAGLYRLRLLSRGGEDGFEEVVLSLRRPGFAVVAAEVLDGAGNRMLYEFPDLKRNGGVSAKRFRFEPPPGTEITGEP
jgi:outer membrane lipoprotein carrier protein